MKNNPKILVADDRDGVCLPDLVWVHSCVISQLQVVMVTLLLLAGHTILHGVDWLMADLRAQLAWLGWINSVLGDSTPRLARSKSSHGNDKARVVNGNAHAFENVADISLVKAMAKPRVGGLYGVNDKGHGYREAWSWSHYQSLLVRAKGLVQMIARKYCVSWL